MFFKTHFFSPSFLSLLFCASVFVLSWLQQWGGKRRKRKLQWILTLLTICDGNRIWRLILLCSLNNIFVPSAYIEIIGFSWLIIICSYISTVFGSHYMYMCFVCSLALSLHCISANFTVVAVVVFFNFKFTLMNFSMCMKSESVKELASICLPV